MTLPALSPRGFWTRVAVFGASLVVYMWAVLIMAREDSLVGVVLLSLGALLGLTRPRRDCLAPTVPAPEVALPRRLRRLANEASGHRGLTSPSGRAGGHRCLA
jgi:hypothetical protein